MAGRGRRRRAARDRRWRFSPPPQFASRALPRAATDHLRSLVDPQDHRAPWTRSGDGLLAEFSSVADALRCALDIQRGMAERNADVPQEKHEFRIGINVGEYHARPWRDWLGMAIPADFEKPAGIQADDSSGGHPHQRQRRTCRPSQWWLRRSPVRLCNWQSVRPRLVRDQRTQAPVADERRP
jgi:hypothetical protein